jgi:hypothetical protein
MVLFVYFENIYYLTLALPIKISTGILILAISVCFVIFLIKFFAFFPEPAGILNY